MNNNSAMCDVRAVLSSIPEDLNWLIIALTKEMNDPDFINLKHGERHTRNKGCTGPMCQKALRDSQRERRRTINALAGRTTRPHVRSSDYVRIDPIISDVKAAHIEEYRQRSERPAELQTVGREAA